jgi:hypothetical protein
MDDKAALIQRFIPDIIAILLVIICTLLILCGHDGIFKNILSALVGYYFGQKTLSKE